MFGRESEDVGVALKIQVLVVKGYSPSALLFNRLYSSYPNPVTPTCPGNPQQASVVCGFNWFDSPTVKLTEKLSDIHLLQVRRPQQARIKIKFLYPA